MAFWHKIIQRSLPVNFQYSFKWVLQMIWNYSICVRHSGYERYVNEFITVTHGGKSSPFSYQIKYQENRIPLFAYILNLKRARPDQGSSDGLFTCTSLVSKGLQNGQTLTRRCDSGGRFCGCAIQPPCGRGNSLRLSDVQNLRVVWVTNMFGILKKWIIVFDGQKH